MTLFSPALHIQPNLLFAVLSADPVRQLHRELEQLDIREGAVLREVGSGPQRIFFPISGVISIRVRDGSSSEIEVATIGCETADGFDETAGTFPPLTRAVVQGAGRFHVISVAAFQAAAAECDELARLAAFCKAWQLLQSQVTATCNPVHTAESRICRWLLRTSDALGRDLITVTQETIAEGLGIRRTTANFIAQHLVAIDAIRCGRGKIAIRDRAALQGAACDCYCVLGRDHWPSELLRVKDHLSDSTEPNGYLSH
jgi:CRP-like cAMP-binding protein